MSIRGEYIGMGLTIDDLDIENVEYFRHCAEHDFHLQACAGAAGCAIRRPPPARGARAQVTWKKVEGQGSGAFLQRGAPCDPAGVSRPHALSDPAGRSRHPKGRTDRRQGAAGDRQFVHAGRPARTG